MNTLPQPANDYNHLNEFQRRALDTRRRRQAARPTKAQQAAFWKSVGRGGRGSLTVEELGLLATHPYLAASQRAEFAAMAQAAVENVVR